MMDRDNKSAYRDSDEESPSVHRFGVRFCFDSYSVSGGLQTARFYKTRGLYAGADAMVTGLRYDATPECLPSPTAAPGAVAESERPLGIHNY